MWNKAKASETFKTQLLQWIDEETLEDRNRVLFGLEEKPEQESPEQADRVTK